jgi:hypothetical protein
MLAPSPGKVALSGASSAAAEEIGFISQTSGAAVFIAVLWWLSKAHTWSASDLPLGHVRPGLFSLTPAPPPFSSMKLGGIWQPSY